MATYTVLLRDASTLELLGELRDWVDLHWVRHAHRGGNFQLTVSLRSPEASRIAINRLIEIRRDGDFEFAGIVRRRTWRQEDERWEVAGPDLLAFWANRRLVDPRPDDNDEQVDVPAEEAIRHYFDRNLTNPDDSDRNPNLNGDLDGVELRLEDISGRSAVGLLVGVAGRWNPIADTVEQAAQQGGVVPTVELVGEPPTAYELRVREARDRLDAFSGEAVTFSTRSREVGQLEYTEDFTEVASTAVVLGDQDSVTFVPDEETEDDFYGELNVDAGGATSTTLIASLGAYELESARLRGANVESTPMIVGAPGYRSDWDLGDVVRVRIEDIDVEVERQITEVRVTITENEVGEIIEVSHGISPAQIPDLLRRQRQRSTRTRSRTTRSNPSTAGASVVTRHMVTTFGPESNFHMLRTDLSFEAVSWIDTNAMVLCPVILSNYFVPRALWAYFGTASGTFDMALYYLPALRNDRAPSIRDGGARAVIRDPTVFGDDDEEALVEVEEIFDPKSIDVDDFRLHRVAAFPGVATAVTDEIVTQRIEEPPLCGPGVYYIGLSMGSLDEVLGVSLASVDEVFWTGTLLGFIEEPPNVPTEFAPSAISDGQSQAFTDLGVTQNEAAYPLCGLVVNRHTTWPEWPVSS
ncbi:MAG: Gp37-like protein [Myxococcota bacterium]